MDTFDMPKFISEIQKEPAIWDYKSEEYSNKIQKVNAWEKICGMFHDNFERLSTKEKSDVAVGLQRKWKSLRDCFNRELKNAKKLGTENGALKRKKYIYFDQLLFLEPLVQHKETTLDDKELFPIDVITPEEIAPKKIKLVKEEKLKVPKERLSQRSIAETASLLHDEYTLFCLSLVNYFKKINDDHIIDAKCEVLQVLNKYKRMKPSDT